MNAITAIIKARDAKKKRTRERERKKVKIGEETMTSTVGTKI